MVQVFTSWIHLVTSLKRTQVTDYDYRKHITQWPHPFSSIN